MFALDAMFKLIKIGHLSSEGILFSIYFLSDILGQSAAMLRLWEALCGQNQKKNFMGKVKTV